MDEKNYTIGKGRFALKKTGRTTYAPLGNVTEGKVTFAVETKDHYSTESAAKTKDFSTTTSIDATLAVTVDNISINNVKNYLLAEEVTLAQTAGIWDSGTELALAVAALDEWHDMGKMMLSSIVVKDETDTDTYVLGTDYEINTDMGMIRPLSTGAILQDEVLHITGSYAAGTSVVQLLAGLLTNIEGNIMFMADPTSGRKLSFKGDVQMSPTGDLPLISDDYATMSFNCIFTKGSAKELFRLFTTPAA